MNRLNRIAVLVSAVLALSHPHMAHAQLVPLVVRSVSFKGNKHVDAEVLAASILTTQSDLFATSPFLRWLGWGQKRVFNQVSFLGDIQRLLVVYRRSGYPQVQIDTTLRREPGAIYITFRITEGPPVILQNLDIYGLDSVDNAWRIRQDLPLAPHDVASDLKLHETTDTIELRLRNHGYPNAFVRVVEQEHAASENDVLQVITGKYARFGSITVHAEPGVDTAFTASLIAARPGNEFRLNDVVQSQRTLYTSDLYQYATVDVDSLKYHVNDTLVPIVVTVKENAAHRARASAGYGTDDCFRVGTGWTARNFPGSGLVFDVTGQLSKIGVGSPLGIGLEHNVCAELRNDSIGSRVANYGLNASLRRNAFLSPNNSLALSVFATQHGEFEVYLRQEIGASISLTRTTAANVPVTIAYRIADGTTTANSASFCAFFNTCDPAAIAVLQQRRRQGTLSVSILRQRLNNPLDPLRGSVLSASAVTSLELLGSSPGQQFTRLVGDASAFVPINRTTVLAGHVRAGIIFAPSISLGGETGNFVPPDQRFYAGGSNDVRGYDQNELGPLVYVVPTDSIQADSVPQSATRVSATGGTRVVTGNLELRIPTPVFSGRLRVALFVDAGALWLSGERTPLRVTPGVGLRYSSPLGPIRFDVGYNSYALQPGPLYAISTDGSLTRVRDSFVKDRLHPWTLHFSVGQAF